MIIILTDGISMAGDGMIISGWTAVSLSSKKVLRVGKYIVGTIGKSVDRDNFVCWLNDHSVKLPPFDETFEALVLDHNGIIFRYGPDLRPVKLPGPQAIGCGGETAMILLDQGYDLEKIIELIATRNIGVGGSITKITKKP